MADIVGIRFKRTGKVYYFDPAGIELAVEDCVVVNTNRGMEMGYVVIAPEQVLDSEINEPLKPVLRKASCSASLHTTWTLTRHLSRITERQFSRNTDIRSSPGRRASITEVLQANVASGQSL